MNTTATNPRDDHTLPIAIVGMAATFPGADNVEDLWRLLKEGMNTVSEVRLPYVYMENGLTNGCQGPSGEI